MDGKRIDKVLASPIDLPDAGEADGALPWNDSENRDTSQHR